MAALDESFRAGLDELPAGLDREQINGIWSGAMSAVSDASPKRVHGDIAPGNLIQRDGRLRAIIDFGLCAAGDPACDLAIAWLAFDSETRREFLQAYGTDEFGQILRARAWALWKAVLVLAGHSQQPSGNLPPDITLNGILSEPLRV